MVHVKRRLQRVTFLWHHSENCPEGKSDTRHQRIPPQGRTFFISQSSRGLSFWSKPNCLIASFSLQIEIIYCRLKSFLDERNILEAFQSGFQTHHSWLFRGGLMTFGAEVLCPNDSHKDTSCVENLKVLFLGLFSSPHTFRPWNL